MVRNVYTFFALAIDSPISFPQQMCPAISTLTVGFCFNSFTTFPNISSAPGRNTAVPP